MSEEFWIKEKDVNPPLAMLEIGGRIGVQPAKELRSLASTLKARGVQHVVLDMSNVTFIASSGIGALVVITGEFSIGGGSAQLVGLSTPVMRAIKLVNVDQFLKIALSLSDAMNKIGLTA